MNAGNPILNALPRRRFVSGALLALLLLGPAVARAQTDSLGVDNVAVRGTAPDSAGAMRAAPDTAAVRRAAVDGEPPRATSVASAVAAVGLENVRVEAASETLRIGYENRRFRHSAEALGAVARRAGGPFIAFESRLALPAAALTVDTSDARRPFRVRYPTDRGFPAPPSVPKLEPTSHSVDFEVGPLVTYEVGHIFHPFQLRVEIEPRVRYNPWPGALATAALILPLQNDFTPTTLDPDIDQVRPGPLRLDQFAFLPGVALFSGSAGYFGENRYGLSLGAARPMLGGRLVVDGQWDDTGFLAFPGGGTLYSSPDRWSGFAGVTWRPPLPDVAVSARAERYLYGDQGVEVEVRRSMGDLDVGGVAIRSAGINLYGVRVVLPVPPMRRSTANRVRFQPVDRFPLEFRSTSEAVATSLSGVASREEFLRQLDESSLEDNLDRYRRGDGPGARTREAGPPQWISVSGMTGFVNTPWAGVLRDRDLAVGYRQVPRRWAYDHRGRNDNQVYYATLGFLPHVEAAMRWTRIPGYHSFEELAPDSRLTDIDRMVSGRLEILAPRLGRPGVAVGVEDGEGTRRFHSTYIVTGIPIAINQVQSRVSLGYGFRALEATRYVLDGAFGALEVSPWRRLVIQIEHDSEKWNTALGVEPGWGFQLTAGWLHLESPTLGIGWHHPL